MVLICIGISACLTGQAVRYDGHHKYSHLCMEELTKSFQLKSFCPEVAIGMGVPRAPIRLVGNETQARALGVEDPDIDVSQKLEEYAHSLADQISFLSGYIFTERSPSCGLSSTKVFGQSGNQVGQRSGLFAARLQKLFPLLPMTEAERLDNPLVMQAFINDVVAYSKTLKP